MGESDVLAGGVRGRRSPQKCDTQRAVNAQDARASRGACRGAFLEELTRGSALKEQVSQAENEVRAF